MKKSKNIKSKTRFFVVVFAVVMLFMVFAPVLRVHAQEETECEHLFSITSLEEYPTCEKDGRYDRICCKCGYAEFERIAPRLGGEHDWVLESTLPADCRREQQNTYRCSKCNDWKEEVIPGLKEHDFVEMESSYQAPTCTAEGMEYQECTMCGEKTLMKTLPKSEHDFSVLLCTVDPTSTKDGYREYQCSRCNERKKEVIPKKVVCQHTNTAFIKTQIRDTTTVECKTVCKDCGYTISSVKEDTAKCHHKFKKSVFDKEATCISKPLYHLECLFCGEVTDRNCTKTNESKNPDNHVNLRVTVTKEPTYKEAGERKYVCKDCGYNRTEVIPKLTGCKHKHEETGVYLYQGQHWIKCADCGEYLRVAENVQPEKESCVCNGGTTEKLVKKATETTPGQVDLICNKCGRVKRSVTIPAYKTYRVQKTDGSTETIYGYFDEEEVRNVYRMLNEYRKANGLNTLSYNSACQWASDQRALDCIVYFEHTRPNGQRWNTLTPNWQYGGENIALGYTNSEKVMTGWKNSPGHNSNMLYSTYKGVSIACFKRIVFDNGSNIPRVCNTTWSQNFTFYEYQ